MQRTTADQDSKPFAAAAPTPVSSPGVTSDSTATTTTLASECKSSEPKVKKHADRGSRKRRVETGSASSLWHASTSASELRRQNCGCSADVGKQYISSSLKSGLCRSTISACYVLDGCRKLFLLLTKRLELKKTVVLALDVIHTPLGAQLLSNVVL